MSTNELRKSHPILTRIPILGRFVDERFLEHRRRSTSAAAIVGALVALVWFEYKLIFEHTICWDLFAVIGAMAATKIVLMSWFHSNN